MWTRYNLLQYWKMIMFDHVFRQIVIQCQLKYSFYKIRQYKLFLKYTLYKLYNNIYKLYLIIFHIKIDNKIHLGHFGLYISRILKYRWIKTPKNIFSVVYVHFIDYLICSIWTIMKEKRIFRDTEYFKAHKTKLSKTFFSFAKLDKHKF